MGEVFTTALPMFPAQLRLVSVGCGECRRGGWYRLDRLVARYGSDGPIRRPAAPLSQTRTRVFALQHRYGPEG